MRYIARAPEEDFVEIVLIGMRNLEAAKHFEGKHFKDLTELKARI